jgi:hypothetical protein
MTMMTIALHKTAFYKSFFCWLTWTVRANALFLWASAAPFMERAFSRDYFRDKLTRDFGFE